MNITFQLEFGGIPWYPFIGSGLVWSAVTLYLGYRVVSAMDKWVDYYGRRREAPVPPGQAQSPSGQVVQAPQEVFRSRPPRETQVPDVPPESILRRAPKPAGFGGGYGDKQSGQTGPEGGDASQGPPPPAAPPACPPGKL